MLLSIYSLIMHTTSQYIYCIVRLYGRLIISSDLEELTLTCIAREAGQGNHYLFFLCPIKNVDAYYILKNFVV